MMSSMNEEDPFLQVQQDVLSQLQATRPLFASYLRIRSLAATPTMTTATGSSGGAGAGASPELASARADLEGALAALADDLADLIESVKAVESDAGQFGLGAGEVARRRRLVQEVGGEVEDMREELAAATATVAQPDGRADDDDHYAEFEQQQQVQMMRDQDEELDGVFVTVGNLRRQADDMGRELEEQHDMLEGVDRLADRVGGRLQTGMQKLNYMVRKNEDRLSSCCIAVLITVLIILLVLLLVL